MASKTQVTRRIRRRKEARRGTERKREINRAGGSTPSKEALFQD